MVRLEDNAEPRRFRFEDRTFTALAMMDSGTEILLFDTKNDDLLVVDLETGAVLGEAPLAVEDMGQGGRLVLARVPGTHRFIFGGGRSGELSYLFLD